MLSFLGKGEIKGFSVKCLQIREIVKAFSKSQSEEFHEVYSL